MGVGRDETLIEESDESDVDENTGVESKGFSHMTMEQREKMLQDSYVRKQFRKKWGFAKTGPMDKKEFDRIRRTPE